LQKSLLPCEKHIKKKKEKNIVFGLLFLLSK
jgi:hypothetical protein